IIFMFLALLMLPSFSYAGEADVEFVEATLVKGSYFFEVTVRHADEGWEHFANWYRIRTEDGREI
ncbi:MAG: hypothetical protein GWN86_20045, partial [Desulfobacterales bacterium]|nr:hypothetical protein [Desulfobacterales bacterium]